jgi:hypothetical protein
MVYITKAYKSLSILTMIQAAITQWTPFIRVDVTDHAHPRSGYLKSISF